jgi:hypothetical protein
MNTPTVRYAASSGIRPARRGGKVRGVAYEYEPGGGMQLWYCDHDHAPGVKRCQELTDEQRAEAQACAEAWLRDQIASGQLSPRPITQDG